MPIKYTKEFLISELQRFELENNRSPRMMDMQIKFGYPSSSSYVRQFGSWNNALLKCNLEINQEHLSPKFSVNKEFLISELHRFVKENGRNPIFDDMGKKSGFPSPRPYIEMFGTWNNTLLEAGLPFNHYQRKLDGSEVCCNCNKNPHNIWRYDMKNNRYCPACFAGAAYRFGNLDPESTTGLGYIGQVITREALSLPIKNDYNISDNFNSPFDLYDDDKYGEINVKCAKLCQSKIWNNTYWSFNIGDTVKPDYYFMLGLSENKNQVEHVWVVNSDALFIKNKCTAVIANSINGLNKRIEFEDDNELYNNIYHNINWNNDTFLNKHPLEE